jgi:hypothetical protein
LNTTQPIFTLPVAEAFTFTVKVFEPGMTLLIAVAVASVVWRTTWMMLAAVTLLFVIVTAAAPEAMADFPDEVLSVAFPGVPVESPAPLKVSLSYIVIAVSDIVIRFDDIPELSDIDFPAV